VLSFSLCMVAAPFSLCMVAAPFSLCMVRKRRQSAIWARNGTDYDPQGDNECTLSRSI